jgi:hypothetical protein
MLTQSDSPIRYFVGCQPTRRGGWFVGYVILKDGKEVGRMYRTDIATKREAKALKDQMNEGLR